MYENKPEMAKEWQSKTGDKALPERVGKTKKQKHMDALKRGMSGKR